nr:hypothetical protein [Tanacetum cinerariifolium]
YLQFLSSHHHHNHHGTTHICRYLQHDRVLTKSDASEGFNQIVDFLTAHTIQYALMVNPTIYVSCIKKFWVSVSIKKSNDVIKLQALIDRKKVIITEDTILQALQLDDVDGIDCLPNEEILLS